MSDRVLGIEMNEQLEDRLVHRKEVSEKVFGVKIDGQLVGQLGEPMDEQLSERLG